jgi:hypothetical protein
MQTFNDNPDRKISKAIYLLQVVDNWQRRVKGHTPEQLAGWLLTLKADYNVT